MRLFSDNKLFRGEDRWKTKRVCANSDVNSKLEIVKLKLSCKKKGPKNAKKVIIDFCF